MHGITLTVFCKEIDDFDVNVFSSYNVCGPEKIHLYMDGSYRSVVTLVPLRTIVVPVVEIILKHHIFDNVKSQP